MQDYFRGQENYQKKRPAFFSSFFFLTSLGPVLPLGHHLHSEGIAPQSSRAQRGMARLSTRGFLFSYRPSASVASLVIACTVRHGQIEDAGIPLGHRLHSEPWPD